MRIDKVHIKRFRSILDQEIEFSALTALVGPNGSGKSAVLRAINAFYDTVMTIASDDYYKRDESRPIEIAVTFSALTPSEEQLFRPYIDRGRLMLTKVIDHGRQSYHGARLQHSGFADVRHLSGKSERREAYNALRSDLRYADLTPVKSAEQAEQSMAAWEELHPDQCKMMLDDGQFFGFRQVGQSRLEKYTRYVFVPAVRDAERDAADARGSAIFQLMELVVRSVIAQNKEFRDFKGKMQEGYAELINPTRVPQLAELAGRLTATLKQYVPSASVVLNWLAAEDLAIPMPKAEVRLEEDRFVALVEKVGHGLQRAFIISLLQHLISAQVREATTETDAVQAPGSDNSVVQSPSLILAIEEPELYQHPTRQRHLARILLQLSQGKIPGVASATQVVYCTHSPLFVGLDRFDCVRRLSKITNPDNQALPMVTSITQATLTQVADGLAAVQEDKPKERFTAETVRNRMQTIMTPWLNEGFFGDVVVLVEGEDDRSALMGAAAQMGIDLEAEGIAIIPCGGKDSIDRPLLVFKSLAVPVFVVFDGDARQAKGEKTNVSLQKLLGVKDPKKFPSTNVTATYAVFESDLDAVVRGRLGENLYVETATQFTREYAYDDFDRSKKSPLFVQRLLERGALRNLAVPELAEIVNSVLAMVPLRERYAASIPEGGKVDKTAPAPAK